MIWYSLINNIFCACDWPVVNIFGHEHQSSAFLHTLPIFNSPLPANTMATSTSSIYPHHNHSIQVNLSIYYHPWAFYFCDHRLSDTVWPKTRKIQKLFKTNNKKKKKKKKNMSTIKRSIKCYKCKTVYLHDIWWIPCIFVSIWSKKARKREN